MGYKSYCRNTLPSVQFNALFLLRHAGQHFAGEHLILRQVIDWAMFVDKHHEKIDWVNFEEIAKEMNLYRFLTYLNAICIENLGIEKNKFPVMEYDKELKKRVLSDILSPEYNDKKTNLFFQYYCSNEKNGEQMYGNIKWFSTRVCSPCFALCFIAILNE